MINDLVENCYNAPNLENPFEIVEDTILVKFQIDAEAENCIFGENYRFKILNIEITKELSTIMTLYIFDKK